MNTITRLIQIVDTMGTGVSPELFSEFSRLLSQIGSSHRDNPAAKKLVNLIHTSAQYLGMEEPDLRDQLLTALQTMCRELSNLSQDPGMGPDASGQAFSQGMRAYADLKEKLDARPLVSTEEMEELKAVILSVDWEISNQTLARFDQITTTLMARLRFHKIFFPFLKIINSMGRYIASKKAAAHKDSVIVLQTVFAHFEQISLNAHMPFSEKKRLIEADIATFNDFKKKIATAQPAARSTAQPAARSAEQPAALSTVQTAEGTILPALSHVDAPKIRHEHTLTSLDIVPEVSSQAMSLTDSQDSEPVGGLPEQGGDVMEDLFNPKESEADRLMDQIHMSMASGKTGAPPSLSQDGPEGFENLVPKRIDNETTPEISRRLDDFFNLEPDTLPEPPEDSPVPLPEEQTPAGDEEEMDGQEFLGDESDQDGLGEAAALFEAEEEAPPEPLILFEADAALPENAPVLEKLILFTPDEDPVHRAMVRLKSFMDSPSPADDRDALAQAGEDLRMIGTLWQSDPEKSLLIDFAGHLLTRLDQAQASGDTDGGIVPDPESETAPETGPDPEPETEEIREEPPGNQDSPEPKKFWPPFGGFKRKRAK